MYNILYNYQSAFEKYFSSEECKQHIGQLVNKIQSYDQILILGNGGSMCIASHIAEDMSKVVGIPSLAFNDANLISCLSNDYSYEDAMKHWLNIFGHMTRDLYDPRTLAIFISSSGESENVIRAAQHFGTSDTITLTGFNPENRLSKLGNINIHIPSNSYGEIESIHATLLHIVLDTLIEEKKNE